MYQIFRATFLIILCSQSLFAGIESYFKMPQNTSGNHSMRNIDFIYTINLDQRPEKFAHCLKELQPYGITPYRFSAVNGWEGLTIEDINNLGVKYRKGMPTDLKGTYYSNDNEGKPAHEIMNVVGKNYFSHCMARGPIGIVLSHASILQDALNKKHKTIWVMEDDIKVLQNPHLISEMIDKLDKLVGKDGWDIFFTDQDTKNQNGEYVPCTSYARRPDFTPKNPERFKVRRDISEDFRQIGARYGAYSMIIRRSGIKKILNFIKKHKIFLPYDMEFYLPESVKMFTVRKDIVSTLPNALSDNGAANYKNKLLVPTPTAQGKK